MGELTNQRINDIRPVLSTSNYNQLHYIVPVTFTTEIELVFEGMSEKLSDESFWKKFEKFLGSKFPIFINQY